MSLVLGLLSHTLGRVLRYSGLRRGCHAPRRQAMEQDKALEVYGDCPGPGREGQGSLLGEARGEGPRGEGAWGGGGGRLRGAPGPALGGVGWGKPGPAQPLGRGEPCPGAGCAGAPRGPSGAGGRRLRRAGGGKGVWLLERWNHCRGCGAGRVTLGVLQSPGGGRACPGRGPAGSPRLCLGMGRVL